MTPAEDSAHRLAFARILRRWSEAGEEDRRPRGLLAARIDRFRVARPSELPELLGRPGPSTADLYQSGAWIRGPMVRTGSPAFVPVATALVRTHESGGLEACIRVGLFYEIGGVVQSVGWRFETADRGSDAMHPYPHAQHIDEWVKGVTIDSNYMTPAADGDSKPSAARINERRPAFPLRGASTAAGLAVVTLAALHGGPMVRRWLQEVSRIGISAAVWEDVGNTLARLCNIGR